MSSQAVVICLYVFVRAICLAIPYMSVRVFLRTLCLVGQYPWACAFQGRAPRRTCNICLMQVSVVFMTVFVCSSIKSPKC